MFFTMTDLIQYLKSRLGTVVRRLEIEDHEIEVILKNETLKTLSVYFPRNIIHIIDTKRDQSEDDENGTFYLNVPPEEGHVLSVMNILGSWGSVNSGSYIGEDAYRFSAVYNSGISTGNIGNMFGGDRGFGASIMMGHLNKEIADSATVPYTAELFPPNKVRILPNPAHDVLILKLNVSHTDFSTLPPGAIEIIKELALADMRIAILDIRRYFSRLSTTFGEIELNIDSMDNAESDRREILERLRIHRGKRANAQRIWIA